MSKATCTVKVWPATRKAIKIIAAKKEESHAEIIDRLIKPELDKVEKQNVKK